MEKALGGFSAGVAERCSISLMDRALASLAANASLSRLASEPDGALIHRKTHMAISKRLQKTSPNIINNVARVTRYRYPKHNCKFSKLEKPLKIKDN
jgi:hypothetical protein